MKEVRTQECDCLVILFLMFLFAFVFFMVVNEFVKLGCLEMRDVDLFLN